MAKRRQRREARAAFLFLLPDGLGLTIFVGIPILLAIGVSLFRVSGFGGYTYVGLENFQRMGSDALFLQSVGVTLTMLVVLVPVTFVISLGLALLVKDKFPGIAVVRTLFFLPYVLSLVVIGVIWQFMLVDKRGVLTGLGGIFGLQNVSWLGTPNLALPTLIVISIWFTMGFQMFLFLAGLIDIPQELSLIHI